MKKIYILFGAYLLTILGLFLYSYTQVDLSLTLSRASIFQTIEKSFQYIGYFNRPLSTYFFLAILAALFALYGILLTYIQKISLRKFWALLLLVIGILTFTYNAFSYDFFNYIFYTKIILHYHQNPYLMTALDFPKEPMLSFMHWTHNTYPYGPFWLVLTVPLGFLGFNYFLPTFFIFKIFTAFCFLISILFIGKIFKKIAPDYQIMGMALYAFNPLVMIESLVSAHNDVAMMCLAIIGVYFLLEKKWLLGSVLVILSALTKQAMVFLLLPCFLFVVSFFIKKKFISQSIFLLLCALFTVGGFFAVITKIEVQPWYALWFLPFVYFLKPPKFILWITTGFCLGLLLRYTPFLWQGDWNGMAPIVKVYVTILTPLIFGILFLFYSLLMRYGKK